ncbi:Bacteriocin-protection, YdeI or OmpD-Associated [Rheinheimera pacifica]|uniref:Bacteriocin-protection, YdeI or OmpD-Associated n=1 Tax=Rheinheimera pacifica TaxID=173990 RepID=A0A1H6JMW4_9GAMM|nr:YdeI/OmpD-associated family protein [Rheinheimera pacifica]SEH63406.1 Bacteriocin-protection, YdeI or OmpD-Associated [Rheinheimera pacifica]
MTGITFNATITIRGINPYVLVSGELAKQLKEQWRKPLPVLVQVNGQPEPPWRINMMPVGDGSFYLYLHADVLNASGTGVGDVVQVALQFDAGYVPGPVDPMPDWFRIALEQNSAASQRWNSLVPSLQKEILRYLARLKSAEAQARNTELAIYVLAGGKARFLARSWNE